MYPQGVCRIRKPACAGNGCAIFPIFQTADWGQKIRYPAADDLFRVSLMPVVGAWSSIRLLYRRQARFPTKNVIEAPISSGLAGRDEPGC